jgi:hypothetical protein
MGYDQWFRLFLPHRRQRGHGLERIPAKANASSAI